MGSVDARQAARRPGCRSSRCGCAGGAIGCAGGRRADGARAEVARGGQRRRGRGQYRRRGGDASRHSGDEHAGRKRRRRGRADNRPHARAGTQGARGQLDHACGQVGEEEPAGSGAARQDAGHSRPGTHRPGSCEARARIWAGNYRNRSFCVGRRGSRERYRSRYLWTSSSPGPII